MEKKSKLKELLLALSTEEEKTGYSTLDKVSEVKQSVDSIKNDDSLKKEIEVVKGLIMTLPTSIDNTPVVEALRGLQVALTSHKTEQKAIDYSGFFKDLPTLLTAINASSKKTSEIITNLKWNTSVGVKDRNGSPINPSTEETAQAILAALGGSILPTTLHNGQATVTTAGTRVHLPTVTTKSITVKAKLDNIGNIFVGDSTVSSSTGFELGAGDTISFDIDNLNDVYIDSSISGDGISYIYNS